MAKRAKHVFDTDEVPHLWAHQTQDSARNAGRNLYFEGDTIYSYGSHFPIAKHVVDNPTKKNPEKAILLTTRGYSVTTSKHIHMVRMSIPDGVQVFRVEHPRNAPYSNMMDYVSRVQALAESAVIRKMETKRNDDVVEAEQLIAECKLYCKFTSQKFPKFAKLPKIDHDKVDRQRLAITERRQAHHAKQQAEWDARKAEMKAEADNWNASGICTHTPKHDANNWGDKRKCEEIRENEEWLAKSADIIAAWRAGDKNARLRNAYNLPVMLRIRRYEVEQADGTFKPIPSEVETSRGAVVPVEHALRGLKFVRAVVARGEEFVTNGHTFHLGHYRIDKVEVNGTLHAGCHIIPYAEIEGIAAQLETLAVSEEVQS